MENAWTNPVRWSAMPRRIDIELTSSRPDGSWTWRAAGAREPKGVVDASVVPDGAKVGDELKVDVEQELDGLTVLGVVHGRAKAEKAEVIELLPSDRPFEPVTEQRARRDDRGPRRPGRDDRGDRRDRGGERRPRRDDAPGARPDRGLRPQPGDRPDRGARPERGDRDDRGARPGGDRRLDRRQRPTFTPPPELPQRPKPKRLRPGSAHRNEVLAALPEEQRPIAELALQGIAAVRQRLRDENRKLAAAGKPTMPEASVLKLAEELLPTLRVAEWLDRAEAAQRQLEHLDLRDLRSVVAAADDPVVARDESTRELAGALKTSLATKQEHELELWFGDIDAAISVGRVIRALRLSSQPPKAGIRFPAELGQRLTEAAMASLTPADGPDRWAAVLEAAAFSPVRAQIAPTAAPQQITDDLRSTMTRLAPALPQVAALFGMEVAPNASMPKPLRPQPRPKPSKDAGKQPGTDTGKRSGTETGKRSGTETAGRRPPAPPKPAASEEPTAMPAASQDAPAGDAPPDQPSSEDTPVEAVDAVEAVEETPTVEVVEVVEVVETPTVEAVEVVEETPAEIVETPTVEVVEETPAQIVETPTVEVVEETPAQIVETPTVEVVEDVSRF
jgi:hypothetical protein